jgi:predicted MFS family arabinose efflux permease
LWSALTEPQLARLHYGVFALHAVLMALFITVPFALRDAGLALERHWVVYLPVMLGSFVLMLPAIFRSGRADRLRQVFVGSIAVMAAAHLALPWLMHGLVPIAVFLLLFFTPFNVLEACLPSLVSRIAPTGTKGTAIGVFTSVQFLGTFLGAAGGGYVYGNWGAAGIVIFDGALLVIWLVLAAGTRVPAPRSTRVYALRALDEQEADALTARLRGLPGVHEVRVTAPERRAYLMVDSAGFDEENVLELIAPHATRDERLGSK